MQMQVTLSFRSVYLTFVVWTGQFEMADKCAVLYFKPKLDEEPSTVHKDAYRKLIRVIKRGNRVRAQALFRVQSQHVV